jgi:hypothetical protein
MAGLARCEIIASCGNDVGQAQKDSGMKENILRRFVAGADRRSLSADWQTGLGPTRASDYISIEPSYTPGTKGCIP